VNDAEREVHVMTRYTKSNWLALASALAIGCAFGCGSSGNGNHGSGGSSGAGTGGTTGSGGSGTAGTGGSSTAGAGGSGATGGTSGSGGVSGSGGSSGAGGSGGSSGTAPLLHISSNKRTLMDANDKPFYLVGDTAWALLPGLTVAQATSYFQTRASQGYNAVLMDADIDLGASPVGAPERGPKDVNGNEPFNGDLSGGNTYDVSTVPTANDTTSTAAKYWANVDQIITAASQNGIQIIFDVYDNYNPWFGSGSSPNSTAKLKVYGQFLGQRYVHFDNIIWMVGNDYSESSQGDVNLGAVIDGIRQYDTRHIGWAIDEYGAGFDNGGLRSDFEINSIYEYSAGPWRSIYLAQYNRSDYGPIINIESGYENNTSLGVSNTDVRNEHYNFLLDGATGDTYGNEYVWPFADSWQNWQNALTSQGAHEVTHFAKLVNSIAWQNLIPDQNGTVFPDAGSVTDYAGAYTSDGTLALAYQPATGQGSQTFNVKMGHFTGQVTARWYDPTTGTYTNIGSFTNSGTHTFDSPNANGAGQNDFLLVLKTQ
jgi:Protein of unknown function (DUF4038)/Putative collagen-binding domain of a collagenase